MEQSTNYNFNLPSKNDETSADIDLISDNFRTVDDVVKQVDDVVKQVQDDVSKIPTNLVNGSAYGSVRGIDAKEEEDGYIMGACAVALGYGTAASGDDSHAEGLRTTASGSMSHAEGWVTTASGECSHAEGDATTASGGNSHAEGGGTIASGIGSHAEGHGTIAGSYCQHAQGKNNIADNDNKYLHIVGNGEDAENRSNAHTLDWDGNAWFASDVYVGGASQDDESATKLSSVATDITQVKEKLDGIEEGANKTIVDSELSDTSTNPLQNKVVTEKINSANTTISSIYNRVKNQISYLARTYIANTTMLKIGTFSGDGSGGRAIITINGKKGWNYKSDGGLKVLTLSSNTASTTSTDIHTGGTFYDFGYSNEQGTDITDFTQDVKIVLVRPDGYSTKKVDVYIKFNINQYNSFFVTVDYSDGCSWETDVKAITTSDIDPTTDALSSFVVPTKYIGDITKVNSVLESKANSETGNCTLTVSNGTVSNATYSVVGNMVTLNFNIAPTGAGNVVVSGLPFTATKNQSGVASSTATYNIATNQTSVSINSTSGTAEYCTVTYLK